jgi:antirestriction protein ArdC
MKADFYQRVTDQIVLSLEQGVRPWMKPWSAEHAAGRITRPLRANGVPYQGINVLMLWGEAEAKGYSAPIWMTFQQALELNAHVRKGEHGSTVVYASILTRNLADATTGEETEQAIPFLKSYTVFNVEQIEGLPAQYLSVAEPRLDPVQRISLTWPIGGPFQCRRRQPEPPAGPWRAAWSQAAAPIVSDELARSP